MQVISRIAFATTSSSRDLFFRQELLLVDVQQLLTEDLVGECGLDLADTVFGKICLSRFHRPRHHVDMGMIPFVMEGGVPAEILRRYFHRRGDIIDSPPLAA